MSMRNVTFANATGRTGTFRLFNKETGEPIDYARTIFSCTLECGHFAQVTCMEPPMKLDCMRCGKKPVQLALPMHLPTAREAFRVDSGRALIDTRGV